MENKENTKETLENRSKDSCVFLVVSFVMPSFGDQDQKKTKKTARKATGAKGPGPEKTRKASSQNFWALASRMGPEADFGEGVPSERHIA